MSTSLELIDSTSATQFKRQLEEEEEEELTADEVKMFLYHFFQLSINLFVALLRLLLSYGPNQKTH